MARIHEYQGKALLREAGLNIPQGEPVSTPAQARQVAEDLINNRQSQGVQAGLNFPQGEPVTTATQARQVAEDLINNRQVNGVVLKIQAWTTGRKALGGVAFTESPDEAGEIAARLLAMTVGNFPVEQVLVEEQIAIKDELFVSLSIDDAKRRPVMLLALVGGSGIEERAELVQRLDIDVQCGIDQEQLKSIIEDSPIDVQFHAGILGAVNTIYETAKKYEARSVEINPLVTTMDGRVVAADCRMTIDDYAVFRQPELGIEIARELDHPPTALERIAYDIEQADHRGTFYFAQLPTDAMKPIVGFHGAGGGGSMMSMDAITHAGFSIANFTDTSGNPSSAKVYRAARVILSQDDLVGYFGSGSGVASQEQFHSAYGLAKAFIELKLEIPAVIRLGGNSEDRAVEILNHACANLPGTVEGYKKDDTPARCAERFKELATLAGHDLGESHHRRRVPAFVNSTEAYSFPIAGGMVWIDWAACSAEVAEFVVQQAEGIFELNAKRLPILAIAEDEVANRDSELIACEIECYRRGMPVVFVDLPIAGIDD